VLRRFVRIALVAGTLALLATAVQAEVKLPDPAGKMHAVSDFLGKGKWTVVVIWSVDCPICKREIFHMAFFHDEHKGRDATVLGISIDGVKDRQRVIKFVNDQALGFPNLIGTVDTPELLSKRSFVGTPTYFVFNPKGKFMTQLVGPVTQEQMERYIKIIAEEQKKKGS